MASPVSNPSSSVAVVHSPPLSSVISTTHRRKQDSSTVSLDTRTSGRSTRSHQEYLDSLEMPTQDMVEKISEVQEHKEGEKLRRRMSSGSPEEEQLDRDERGRAVGLIQRGYRQQRAKGLSLDASSRWVEAVKEARYRNLLQPRPRDGSVEAEGRYSTESLPVGGEGSSGYQRSGSAAMQKWRKIGVIVRRAGGDEDPDSDPESTSEENLSEQEREARRKRRMEQKLERQSAAKMMDLQYFLEMVDLRHRYGSNLRTYHEQWKKADTNENFFYWLDYGEGRLIDCQGCSRERLERECVRYLSREERLDYLVKINKEGRLVWAKNGALIDTTEEYKDSIHGIVPAEDNTPAYTPARYPNADEGDQVSSDDGSASLRSDDQSAAGNKYVTSGFDNAHGVKKINHVSAATIFNKMLRGSVTKNTWIFVADTSFRLYVGIKQSGAFQHSSFLHGSRISAAGSIKIKNGRLSKLSPLSGHYRPPVSNFRAFVHSLKIAGVDMSHVSTSRSYAVLVGLEAYVKTRRKGKKMLHKMVHHREKILSPAEVAKREEAERDKSESAAKERRFLELKQQVEEQETGPDTATVLLDKLHIAPKGASNVENANIAAASAAAAGDAARRDEKVEEKIVHDYDIQAPGTGPENAIAPEGTRHV